MEKLSGTDREYGIRKKFIDWSITSSCHGYPKIFLTKSLFLKFLWAAFFLGSASVCVWTIKKSVTSYFEFDVSATMRLYDEVPMEFPTITFCNSNLFQTPYADNYLRDSFVEYFGREMRSFNQTFQRNRRVYQAIDALIFSKERALKKARNSTNSTELIRKFGYELNETISKFKAEFNEHKINISEFEYEFNEEYGNCFKFNSGIGLNGQKMLIKRSNRPGYKYGLFIVLNLPTPRSIYNFEYYSGLRLFIHNNTVKPLNSEGIFLRRGIMHFVGLTKTISYKKPYPYSECIEKTSKKYTNSIIYHEIQRLNRTYRQKDCVQLCLKKEIIDKCDCYLIEQGGSFGARPCLSFRDTNCAEQEYFRLRDKDIRTRCMNVCPLECEYIAYDYVISNSNFPSKHFSQFVKDTYDLKTLNFDPDSITEIRENNVGVAIYFDELKYTLMAEKELNQFVDLIASIGGALGLFLGMSLLSFIEIVEIIIEVVYVLIKGNKVYLN